MNLRRTHRTRDNLHRLVTRAIMADILQIPSSADQHAVPGKQRVIQQGTGEGLVEIDHHLRYALLCRTDLSLVCSESQLALDGGLDARAVEYFSLDLRRGERLGAHRFHSELVAIIIAKVLDGPQEHTAT